MPLIKGKSKQAFSKNVETEMDAGKPQKQSLAIAYSMKKKAKKMADGGIMGSIGSAIDNLSGNSNPNVAKGKYDSTLGKPVQKAEGGMIHEDEHSASIDPTHMARSVGRGPMMDHESGYQEHEGNDVKHDSMAMREDDRSLGQHGEVEEGPQGGGQGFHEEEYMGNPGDAHDEYQSEAHEDDMVGRIIKQRQQMYSEGGRVANSDKPLADGMKAEYDDLHLRDDLESSYTGANSGDELGDAREDKDRADIVSRIMKSRAKKDRLPNPR